MHLLTAKWKLAALAFCLFFMGGQACPPNANQMMPVPTPLPPVAGQGILVNDTTVSLDTDFTDGRYWKLDGNAGTSTGANFLGTTDAQPLELYVNGTRALRLEPTANCPNVIGGFDGNTVKSGVLAATISGGGPSNPDDAATSNRVFDDFGTIAGGANNQAGSDDGDTTNQPHATVGGGEGNRADGSHSTIGGGRANSAAGEFPTIGGGESNLIFDNYGTIGGGENNRAGVDDGDATNQQFATVGGGNNNQAIGSQTTIGGGTSNIAGGNHATVGGGTSNVATGNQSTVAGGTSNEATDSQATVAGGNFNKATAIVSTVCGGFANDATGVGSTICGGQINGADGFESFVGGGQANESTGDRAIVTGGFTNVAGGNFSVVPGGRNNNANNTDSFAAGRRAKADHNGAFVWGDSTNADVASFGNNTFSVRASGGTRFYSSDDLSTGVELAAGDGAFASLSDRSVKENFEPVDVIQVLDRVAAMPIQTWNYVAQDDAIRHIGPTAQDFHSAFGLGHSERRIVTIDADGIALAAIQGLHQQLKAKDRELAEQDKKIAELKGMAESLEQRLLVLESSLE